MKPATDTHAATGTPVRLFLLCWGQAGELSYSAGSNRGREY